MTIRIQGGETPEGGPSLCDSYQFAHIIKGQNLQETVLCGFNSMAQFRPVLFKVSSCNKYRREGQPDIYEMREIAWRVTARERGQTGFGSSPQMEYDITPPKEKKE